MAGRKRILVVDDEPDLVELVSYNLKKEGYDIDSAPDGEKALDMVRREDYNLVVLDLMLPGIQGVDLCRRLREDARTSRLPVVMLTARSEETDKVVGLETGADDYITKPFSPRELVARVRAVLRRAVPAREDAGVMRVGNIVIDPATYTAAKDGMRLNLSATEFRLLAHLAGRRGRVFTRDQLLDAVWKEQAYVEPRTVDVHIRRLRSQIEDDPARPAIIKTRRGVGYYMEADI